MSTRLPRCVAENQRYFIFWLAQACKDARLRTNTKLVDVAAAAGKDQSSVFRFEDGQTGYPKDLDAYVRAYAEVTGMDSEHDLWEDALAAWRASPDAEEPRG